MSIPAKISRYKVLNELGRGGMATVYLALDPRSGREVAIKVLPREMLHDPAFRARFEREIKALVGLEHPNIVTVYDMGDEDGQPYFVMRYMKGGSLTDRLRGGKLSLPETAGIIEKIAKGLAHAHRKGFIHRDLKPDNILFDSDDNPYISDFGIAKVSSSTGSLTGSKSIGSPMYMSPEQARGEKLDERSDVYSLGVIVYQMLSGKQPYNADTGIGVAVKHVTDPVPEILKEVPSLPIEVDRLIKSSMAKDRTQRFSTPIDLAKALNRAAFGVEGSFPVTRPRTSFSFGKTGLVVMGVLLLVAIIGFFLLRNQLFTVEPSPAPTLVPPVTFTATSVPAAVPTFAPTDTPVKESTTTSTVVPPTATEVAPTALAFAPACSAGVALPTPVITDIDKFCVEKVPYSTLYIPEGASFEPLNANFICKIEKTKNGRSAISCTGISAFSFNLKVCQPPAIAGGDANKCPQGAAFDAANQCCVAVLPDAGCRLYKVDIRSCP
jgi:serine/threonine protein kinase